MNALGLLLFWTSVAALAWIYAGYPLLAWLWARLRPVDLRPSDAAASLVTVGLAVHNAADQLAERLANIFDADVGARLEVIVASDGSTDQTAEVVRQLAAADDRVRLLELPRMGQSAAQARIFEAAAGEIVVLTDAETRFAPGFLRHLLAPLGDARVGCTTGVLRWVYDERTATAQHEGLYWRYEQQVRQWESRAGWLSAATGALLAVRRSVYRPAPAHASLDQVLPLVTREQGLLVLAVPSAVGTDRGSSSLGEQFRSRVRIATQGIEANLRMTMRIPPWRSPGTWLAIWSHKILRWATPFFVLALAVGAALLVAGGHAVYASALAGVGLWLVVAGLAYVAARRRLRLPLAGFALTVLAVNVSFALAWRNVLLRRRIGSW